MVEVVYKGVLELQQKTDDPKSWKKYLFVLKRFRSSETASLEYYKDPKKSIAKQNPRGVLNLLANYRVESLAPFPSRSDKFHFEVRTLEQVYRLATDSRESMDEWIYFLQSQTAVADTVSHSARFFDVQPEKQESLRRIGALGSCRLYVDEEQICLANSVNGTLLARWPLRCLRRYACDEGVFRFEAGRKAPLGEGKYSFLTDEEGVLFDTVEAMVKKQVRKSFKQKSGDGGGADPPLPDRNSKADSEGVYDRLKFETWVPDGVPESEAQSAGYSHTLSSMQRTSVKAPPNSEEYARLGSSTGEEYARLGSSTDENAYLESAVRNVSLDESAYAYAHTPGSKALASAVASKEKEKKEPPPLPPDDRSLPPMSRSSGNRSYENLSAEQAPQPPAKSN